MKIATWNVNGIRAREKLLNRVALHHDEFIIERKGRPRAACQLIDPIGPGQLTSSSFPVSTS